MGYIRTTIELDEECLRLAAQEFGTRTKKDTVNAALLMAAEHHLQMEHIRRVAAKPAAEWTEADWNVWGVGSDIADQEVMRHAR